MEFKKALQVMQHSVTEDERRPMKLAIVVASQGGIGGTQCVEVATMGAGIDWDRGKMMIHPAQPMTTLTADEVADIRKSVAGGQSWHAYQAHKKQQEQLKAVEAERDTWEQRACNEATRVVELEQKLAAAEVLVAARVEQIPTEAKMVMVFTDLVQHPELREQFEEFAEAIKKRCTSGCWTLVAFFPEGTDIQALDDEQLRSAGLERAKAGEA